MKAVEPLIIYDCCNASGAKMQLNKHTQQFKATLILYWSAKLKFGTQCSFRGNIRKHSCWVVNGFSKNLTHSPVLFAFDKQSPPTIEGRNSHLGYQR